MPFQAATAGRVGLRIGWDVGGALMPAPDGCLLDNGAQLEARDKGGMTPLHRAAWTANTALTAFYLEKGADIDARDNNGKTPLDLAVEKNFPGVIQVFNGEEPDY